MVGKGEGRKVFQVSKRHECWTMFIGGVRDGCRFSGLQGNPRKAEQDPVAKSPYVQMGSSSASERETGI